MVTRVFVDADVLFSRTLRDWLFLLKLRSEGSMYSLATSPDVIGETITRYRDRHPTVAGKVVADIFKKIEMCIDERVEDFVVDGTFTGVDPGDAHVDAAARAWAADVVLTNDGGWHKMTRIQLDSLPYEPQDPDYFFCTVDDSAPRVVDQVAEEQLTHWFQRTGDVDLPAALRRAGCDEFAERVRLHIQAMDLSFLK